MLNLQVLARRIVEAKSEVLAEAKAYADSRTVRVTKESLGLGSVDDTPDNYKPLSIVQRSAVDQIVEERVTRAGSFFPAGW